MCIGMCAVGVVFMWVLQVSISTRIEQRKGIPLRKHTNNTLLDVQLLFLAFAIPRRGLNELIFVKSSNLTFFHFFLPVAQN